MQAEVRYLWNSGFSVELDDAVLVFDYFEDAAAVLPELLAGGKKVYFFVSHAHFDHFSPAIAAFAERATRYFFSADLRGHQAVAKIPANKIVYLDPYDDYKDDYVRVDSYSSTDEGTSFLVTLGEWKIFHAGDFNWWHWKEDTAENIALARNGFMKQMKRLDGLMADLAFFPIDLRLEEFAAQGAKEFCRRTNIGFLVGMHNTMGPAWKMENGFFPPGRECPVWLPSLPGERRRIKK